MSDKTDKDFNHKSKIRLLDPSRASNFTHKRLDQDKSSSALGPTRAQSPKKREIRALLRTREFICSFNRHTENTFSRTWKLEQTDELTDLPYSQF